MKAHRIFLFATVLILTAFSISGQDLIQYPVPSTILKMKGIGGKNGAAVVFNPDKHCYYCVIAGNAEYPLECFDELQNNLGIGQAYSDMRGMWWNPKEGALEGNCHKDGGIISIGLNQTGIPGTGNRVIFPGSSHQPGDHAVGTFDPKKGEILYYADGVVVGYSRKNGEPTSTYINLALPVDATDINWTTLIFTGKKGMELGVMDYNNLKVYLFSRKDGALTGTVNLPSKAVTYSGFNFSYANDRVFLFDQDERTWTGYRIF